MSDTVPDSCPFTQENKFDKEFGDKNLENLKEYEDRNASNPDYAALEKHNENFNNFLSNKYGEDIAKLRGDFMEQFQLSSNSSQASHMRFMLPDAPTFVGRKFVDNILKSLKEIKDKVLTEVSAMYRGRGIESLKELMKVQHDFSKHTLNRVFPGKKTVTLYRGVDERYTQQFLKGKSKGLLETNNLESWTEHKHIADDFAGPGGSIVKAEVPIEKVFASRYSEPQLLSSNEAEFMLLRQKLEFEIVVA